MVAPTVLPGGAAIQQIDIRSRLLFSWRAADGLEALTGQAGVYSRASESGMVPGVQGRMVGPLQDDAPQYEMVDLDGDGVPETMGLVLQGLRTNLMTQKDLDSWNKSGSATVSAIVGPDGRSGSAFTVEDANAGAAAYIRRVVAFTGDAVKGIAIAVREREMASAGNQAIRLRDVGGSTTPIIAAITGWVDGEPTMSMSAGVLLQKYQWGTTGWWVLVLQSASVIAANEHEIWIRPADSGSADVGSIDVFFPQAYDAVFPSHAFLDASISRAAESLYFDFLADPQALTLYAKWIERGTGFGAGVARLVELGGGTDRFIIRRDSGTDAYEGRLEMNGLAVNLNPITTPNLGQLSEVRLAVAGDSSATFGLSVAGAPEDTTISAALADGLASTFGAERLTVNSDVSFVNSGFNSFVDVKVAPGVQSMEFMREVI